MRCGCLFKLLIFWLPGGVESYWLSTHECMLGAA
jgi:hypothetical protein